ncbi:hypothetical protein H5410_027077 [Solanum commersonii]|uniref:RING-type E3 ubiquitin transferase n=1 Tax=Solanum commersonii TaxID=4109 RepID=A0A9J5YY89_SOLCO|nr:hypothetical protein H5410_027077 [Solanum commersonii]
MESNNSNIKNTTFSGSSTAANVPRDRGTTKIIDDYYNKKILTEINCGYLYHFDCIRDWIKLKNSCPICKRNVTVTIN